MHDLAWNGLAKDCMQKLMQAGGLRKPPIWKKDAPKMNPPNDLSTWRREVLRATALVR